MVNGTESRRQAEIREKRHLKDQRQGQGLPAAHEKNTFASARPYPKEPTAEKSRPEKNIVKHEGRQTPFLKSKGESLLCFWAVRELGMSHTELAYKLEMSLSNIGFSVERGESIANRGNYSLKNKLLDY